MPQACRDSLTRLPFDKSAHSGLLLSRYLQTPVKEGEQEDKLVLFRAAQQACRNAVSLYANAHKVWQNRIGEQSIRETLQIAGRMVLGLGSESPLETGLRLHHTYGTPLIPGSALKGLAAHYCDQVWGKRDSAFGRSGESFQILFGTTEDSGHIVFYDAWITPESAGDSLVLDVMTVHHPKYYQGDKAPSDFDDPTPIPFLSVRGTFDIALRCDVVGEEGEKWATLAMTLLREALAQWGIGGKTNAGYGRLQPPSALTSSVAQETPAQDFKTGQVVPCVVLEEKTKKGGWRFQIKGSDQTGVLHPQSAVPPDLEPGKTLTLAIAATGTSNFQFRYEQNRETS